MRAVIGYVIVAVVLAGAGLVLKNGSALERRVAAAERDLVTLRYQEAGARAVELPPAWSGYLPGASKTVEDAKALSATSKYWDGEYQDVAADPISAFKLQGCDYPRMGERIAALGLPTVLVQEGGYAVAEIGANVTGVLEAFAD